jgi:hypothetical protein
MQPYTFTDTGDGMKHYYQAELATAVERLRATMAAADSWAIVGLKQADLEPCIVKKGQTLYIKTVRPVLDINRGNK